MPKNNLILDLSFDFSLKIIDYAEILQEKKKFVISNQILKSGTSIGANVFEAQGAESTADFVHKLKIAFKEAYETKYWLKLCEASKSYPSPDNLSIQLDSILKILGKSLSTLSTKI